MIALCLTLLFASLDKIEVINWPLWALYWPLMAEAAWWMLHKAFDRS